MPESGHNFGLMAHLFIMRHTLRFEEELKMHFPPAEVAHKSAGQKMEKTPTAGGCAIAGAVSCGSGLVSKELAQTGTSRPPEFLTLFRCTKVPFALL